MAELLVRVADKVNDDFYMNCQCTKRGDVIVVQENGWNWGTDELTLPFWAIVKLPNISVNAASSLLSPELPVDPLNPSRTLQKRAFKLDLNDPTIAALIAADTRTLPDPNEVVIVAGPAPATIAAEGIDDFALSTLILPKPSIADPTVIGVSLNVIG